MQFVRGWLWPFMIGVFKPAPSPRQNRVSQELSFSAAHDPSNDLGLDQELSPILPRAGMVLGKGIRLGTWSQRFNRSCVVGKLQIVTEYFQFLKQQKKWWMLPIVMLMVLLGLLVLFTQGSPLAPFIYTIF
jgi:uncharacterized protein DUF5989